MSPCPSPRLRVAGRAAAALLKSKLSKDSYYLLTRELSCAGLSADASDSSTYRTQNTVSSSVRQGVRLMTRNVAASTSSDSGTERRMNSDGPALEPICAPKKRKGREKEKVLRRRLE